MKSSAVAIVLCCLLFESPARAQDETPPPMPLEQQEQLEARTNFSELLGGLARNLVNDFTLKKHQCMKAFGNVAFCECIAENSPTGVTFVGYVQIVSATKDDLKYDDLTPDDKKLVDATRASRDKCVNWKGKAASQDANPTANKTRN